MYAKVDGKMSQIPDSLTKSTRGLAKYINANFSSQSDKSRAVFIWISRNIKYNVENMYLINFYENTDDIINEVLKKRKGICMHYAELFNDISRKVGLKTYVIQGYTKQNGKMDLQPHAWCGGFIDSQWVLFDPTWGSGYIQNSKFVRQLNETYFMTKPQQIVKSHIPFDPLWQFLNYPITKQEFYANKLQVNKSKPFFNFPDSVKKYDKETEIERLVSSDQRILKNGVKNSMVTERLQHDKWQIVSMKNGLFVEKYNSAVNYFNEGVSSLNSFINYRNNMFSPKKPDVEIQQMVDSTDFLFNASINTLKQIQNPNATTVLSIEKMNKSIDVAMSNLNAQKDFLKKYLKTSKIFRKTLFYKYTWVGIPLN